MKKYKLMKTFQIYEIKGFKILNKGTNQIILSNAEWDKNYKIFDFIFTKKEFYLKELFIFAENNNIDKKILNYIKNNSVLIESEFDEEDDLSRSQMMLSYFSGNGNFKTLQNGISNINFIIWGCGGIGNYLSYSLAALGAKNFTLIDFDKIEKTNLNRQFLFEKSDLLKNKVNVLKNSLENRFDDLNIKILNINGNDFNKKNQKDLNLLNNLNNQKKFLILSADEIKCIFNVNDFCILKKIPFINVGYFNDISCIGPFYIPENKSRCMRCIELGISKNNKKKKSEKIISNINNFCTKAPSCFNNNSLAATLAISDILFYIKKEYKNIKSLKKRVGIDVFNFKLQFLEIKKNKNCHHK